ncbi:MAG: peptidoglycan-binding protein, partial [Clostridia bacterium]|nr:peptidoglycan-binding protein [Clostridia bacterium]
MKRILAILLVFMLLPAACAQVIQVDDKTIHAYALDYLSRINDANSVAEAAEMFGEITSGYGYSSLYQVYSQAIAAIHAEDMDNAESLLALLAFYPEFKVSLTENSLPLCTDLQTYIEARRAESEGRVIDAMSLYRTINLLDSVQRSVALINLWQAEAYAYAGELFTAGDYEAAADLYVQLGNYSDSASMAERAKALIPTPTPEVTASPTPAPTPVPEYKPLRKGDRGDEVLALQNRLYELGYFSDVRDGIYGGKTVDAVKLFQYAVNLEATGTADRLTLILLYSDNPFEAQNS